MALKIIYLRDKKYIWSLKDDPHDYYVLLANDWDDYGYRTSFYVKIIKNKEIYEDFNRKILFEGQIKQEYNFKKIEENMRDEVYVELKSIKVIKKFISIGDEYEELKKIFPDDFDEILLELNDIVYLNKHDSTSSLLELTKNEAYECSLLRAQSVKKLLLESSKILYGDTLSSERFKFDFNFKLNNNDYKYKFDFVDNGLPHRINILIGKNGVGKSQSIKKIADYLIEPSLLKDVEEFHISDHPSFISNLIVFAYNPYEDFTVPKDNAKLSIIYKYNGFRRYVDSQLIFDVNAPFDTAFKSFIDIYKKDRNNFSHEIKLYDKSLVNRLLDLITSAVPKFKYIGLKFKSDSSILGYKNNFKIIDHEYFDNYLLIDRVDDENEILHEIDFSDFEEKIHFISTELKLLLMSSGQKIFSSLVLNLLSVIKNNSLVLIDEPETALHPNLEIDFMKLLKNILVEFDSFSIIATHSAIITREIPPNFVKVIKFDEEDKPVINPPVINTFGADIGTITNYVFDDIFIQEKPHDNWISEQKIKYSTFDSFENQFKEKLSYDFLVKCRNLWNE